jgi:hypothetical protein
MGSNGIDLRAKDLAMGWRTTSLGNFAALWRITLCHPLFDINPPEAGL